MATLHGRSGAAWVFVHAGNRVFMRRQRTYAIGRERSRQLDKLGHCFEHSTAHREVAPLRRGFVTGS